MNTEGGRDREGFSFISFFFSQLSTHMQISEMKIKLHSFLFVKVGSLLGIRLVYLKVTKPQIFHDPDCCEFLPIHISAENSHSSNSKEGLLLFKDLGIRGTPPSQFYYISYLHVIVFHRVDHRRNFRQHLGPTSLIHKRKLRCCRKAM